MKKNIKLSESIAEKIASRFGGKFDSEEQRADLFVSIDGQEEVIIAVDTEMIYFEDSEHNVRLQDADIRHLVYINHILN